jgi:hypothetical protein
MQQQAKQQACLQGTALLMDVHSNQQQVPVILGHCCRMQHAVVTHSLVIHSLFSRSQRGTTKHRYMHTHVAQQHQQHPYQQQQQQHQQQQQQQCPASTLAAASLQATACLTSAACCMLSSSRGCC